MAIKPTVTTNRFHFSDLDPSRFEEICFMLLHKSQQWLELIHLGRSGADGGIDIRGTLSVPGGKEIWLVQCKRYRSVSLAELKEMADKILTKHTMPEKMLLIVSCEVSRVKYDAINAYCIELGIPQLIIWTDTTLESLLYIHPEIKAIAFGGEKRKGSQQTSAKNAQKISRGLRMRKHIEKALINKKIIGNPAYRERLFKDPSLKFISDEVYIRSLDDETYPNYDIEKKVKISPWFKVYLHDFYHNGLEFLLSAATRSEVVVNKDGLWQPVEYNDPRRNDPQYRVIPVRVIGRIPFSGIMEVDPEGDNYNPCPHLFCLFDRDGMPYEEICYKFDDGKERLFGDYLPKEKRTEFPLD